LRGDISECDASRKLPDLDRRERVRDVAAEALAQRPPSGRRTPDGDLRVGVKKRSKEHQALNVVEMQMCEQNMQLSAVAHHRRRELETCCGWVALRVWQS